MIAKLLQSCHYFLTFLSVLWACLYYNHNRFYCVAFIHVFSVFWSHPLSSLPLPRPLNPLLLSRLALPTSSFISSLYPASFEFRWGWLQEMGTLPVAALLNKTSLPPPTTITCIKTERKEPRNLSPTVTDCWLAHVCRNRVWVVTAAGSAAVSPCPDVSIPHLSPSLQLLPSFCIFIVNVL